ncbi:glycosyltransferase family 8 protein [Riemerella anatipestifer]|nr:glycosyltransferase family 8 protein [Riemerella anatipestifer]
MVLIPFVLTCDDSYFKYANIVITSVMENRNADYHYEFNILSEFISEENQNITIQQLKKYPNASIRFIELNGFDSKRFFLNSYMSASTYYRFYIPEVFSNYNRIIYLDCDLIVDYDISSLHTIDFEDKLGLACPSPYIHNIIKSGGNENFPLSYFTQTLGMDQPLDYFNAGVMVYNLKKINKDGIAPKFFTALNEILEPKLQDQDILNSVFSRNGRIKLIDQKFNNTKVFKITKRRIILNKIKKLLKINDQKRWFYIYHYVGKNKPWKSQRVDNELFYFYAKKSPFYNSIINDN